MDKQKIINIFQTIIQCSDHEMNKTCNMKDCDKCVNYVSRNDMIDAMEFIIKMFDE